PKAVTMGELYGEFNEITRERHDRLVPYYVKEMSEQSEEAVIASEQTSEQMGINVMLSRDVLWFDGPDDTFGLNQ
ncbi:MAG: hypothetical protein EZS28_054584, partial [Streblomastix strix]